MECRELTRSVTRQKALFGTVASGHAGLGVFPGTLMLGVSREKKQFRRKY